MSLSTRFDGDGCRPVMTSTLEQSGVVLAGGMSLVPGDDPSLGAVGVLERLCLWCRSDLGATQEKWCSKRCRQTAWRFRRLSVVEDLGDTPKRLAFADPPFPGLSRKYYRDEPSYAGEVDHGRLLDQLATYDGWALATSREALEDGLLSLIPRGVEFHLCPWIKTHHHPKARGPANIHEYVIVHPARRRLPGVPDALVCPVARGGDSNLIGRKPLKYIAWLFQLLGATPADSLDDRFPGSNVVGRCWSEFRRSAPSLTPRGDASLVPAVPAVATERRAG